MIVHDADLAEEVRMTTVHGQNVKYHHQIIGCNSRLDTLQAAILNAKLKHIDDFIASRQAAARRYDAGLFKLGWYIVAYLYSFLNTCIPPIYDTGLGWPS